MSAQRIPAWIYVVIIPIVNIMLAALAAGIMFWYLDINPIEAVNTMAYGAFGDSYGWGYTLYYTTSFIFTGLAVAVAFQAGLFNIGGEGQAYVGALGVGIVCLALGDVLPFIILLPLSIMAAGIFGAAWAYIPAFLQAKRGSHIVITTIMFNFIAASLMGYLLVEVFKVEGSMSVESAVFAQSAWIPKISEVLSPLGINLQRSPLNLSIVWALICCVGVYFFMWRTRWGYEIRATGQNPSAAKYAGIPLDKTIIMTMLVSGMLAGFFALNVVQGEAHQIKLNLVNGFGFTGIAVALIGRNHPVGIILASLLFGFLYQGGGELQFEYGVDPRIIVVLQGLVILFSSALENMTKHPVEKAYLKLSALLTKPDAKEA
ncbi:ABC transporter permease [Reinekea marina]|uniref:ABC transporter permease n=1 Tax=Reinekea marina TaxID=1310421 RepID=A0ABV7WSR3_9GAMM|nr:ABC transporter permease [Reinekea marina]MBU2864390.1 ABC transporter permease [Reinekea forsetii]MDN3647554.1 ABC transporter permease [Reinekea marina]MDN3651120.1 ABC transporter permease [Reinekea marina]